MQYIFNVCLLTSFTERDIALMEVLDSIVDLVKQKRLSTEVEPEKPVEVRMTHLEDMALEDELAESHYSRLHWAEVDSLLFRHSSLRWPIFLQ